MTKRRQLGLVLIAGAIAVCAAAGAIVASDDAASAKASEPKVACWNHYFPFESEPPDFIAAPRKCLWYKRGAENYAEGALLARKLRWRWDDDRATAKGRLKVPSVGRDFGPGRVELISPVESCGRTVFSRLRYKLRDSRGRMTGGYPIYTCRSR
jgi:hypothetical protein